jgi:hypothetical protein
MSVSTDGFFIGAQTWSVSLMPTSAAMIAMKGLLAVPRRNGAEEAVRANTWPEGRRYEYQSAAPDGS